MSIPDGTPATGQHGRAPGAARDAASAGLRALLARDGVVLVAILILAAALRLAGLESRGRFDGDQGHDMLVLFRMVHEGLLPLLGPPTSIGDFHHGAAYYYLLAPVAWLSGADPTAVVTWIAALGLGGVGATWWFARVAAGRVPALVAGLLMAVSPAAIEESTFIWNPNPIPLFAALALGCAWRAHTSGRVRWWLPAILAAGMVVQLHVLGVVFLPPILALAVTDAISARRAGDGPRVAGIVKATAGGLALAALLFVPLAIHELQSGFEETQRVVAWLAPGGAQAPALDPLQGLAFTLVRVVGWPLVGLVTDTPIGAIVAVSSVLVLAAWVMIAGRGADRPLARWLGLSVLWSTGALYLLAPSLQVVVAGLPNDHYHAFMDPVVLVLVAIAARAVAAGPLPRDGSIPRDGSVPHRWLSAGARSVVALAVAALVMLDLGLSPKPDPNGGWPAARDAGATIAAIAGRTPIDVRGLPIFKTAEGVAFPVIVARGGVRIGTDGADGTGGTGGTVGTDDGTVGTAAGAVTVATDRASAMRPLIEGATLVLACDRLFEAVIGDACGGAAEARFLALLTSGQGSTAPPALVARFALSPRVVVSIYAP